MIWRCALCLLYPPYLCHVITNTYVIIDLLYLKSINSARIGSITMNILNETINKIMDGGDVQEALNTYIKNLEQTSVVLEMTHSFNIKPHLIDIFDPVMDFEWKIHVRGGGLDGSEEENKDEPHFHVLGIPKKSYDNYYIFNNYIFDTRVRLDAPIYVQDSPITLELCPTILKAVIETLHKYEPRVQAESVWLAFVQYWNGSDGMRFIDLSREIPDYSKLPTITDDEWVSVVKRRLGLASGKYKCILNEGKYKCILCETINKIVDRDNVDEALKTYINYLEETKLTLQRTHSFNIDSQLISRIGPATEFQWMITVRAGGRFGWQEDFVDEPHFEIRGILKGWYKNYFSYKACVRLDKPTYINEPPIALKLCPTILAAVINTLKTESKCLTLPANIWETFCFFWNAAMSIPLVTLGMNFTKIPDYSKLPTITDEEWVLAVKSKLGDRLDKSGVIIGDFIHAGNKKLRIIMHNTNIEDIDIPHLHIFRYDTNNNERSELIKLRLDKAEYLGKGYYLTNAELTQIIAFLEKPVKMRGNYYEISTWESCINLWNANLDNPQYDEPEAMPDYRLLMRI